jgi:hypothetical protein
MTDTTYAHGRLGDERGPGSGIDERRQVDPLDYAGGCVDCPATGRHRRPPGRAEAAPTTRTPALEQRGNGCSALITRVAVRASECPGSTAIGRRQRAVSQQLNANGSDGALIEHWNGAAWSVAPAASTATASATLDAVAADGDTVFAVGKPKIP